MRVFQRCFHCVLSILMLAMIACETSMHKCAAAEGAKPQAAEKPAEKPADKPITTASGPIGDLLRKWYAEGTAAGNIGDFYDNRDRGHSESGPRAVPPVAEVRVSRIELKVRMDWAAQRHVMPGIVFGNSSTSAGAHNGGSNPRMMYSHVQGLAVLYAQYTSNNLYIYPEHVDYDPGHNGAGGFGDLYPTNTPYLLISQGSSGSDQPFMQAVPYDAGGLPARREEDPGPARPAHAHDPDDLPHVEQAPERPRGVPDRPGPPDRVPRRQTSTP